MRARGSIRKKLNRLVLIPLGLALAITAIASLWQETQRYTLAKNETLLATAQVFGAAASKAVAAHDATAVLQVLRAVAQVPQIVYAGVEDDAGALLAQMGTAVRLDGDLDLEAAQQNAPARLLASHTVQVAVPVIDGGRRVGRIVLVSDASNIGAGLRTVLMSAGAGSGLAVAVGLLLALRLQRSITRPLVSLADTMANVTRDHAYGKAVDITTDDETAVLADSFNRMTREIRRATDEIVAQEEEMIFRLSRAAEKRDDQTGEHIVRVARLCRLVAEGLGLSAKVCDDIYRASPMHDIGKIGVADAILFKPGRLDAEERREMEKHAENGYEILRGSKSKLIRLAAEIALTHHERWDGAGYPRKLRGDEIPLPGRITAVADVCDALASERPYKEAWSLDRVKAHLIEHSGRHFDPACVQALLENWKEVDMLYAGPEKLSDAPAAEAA